jgi:UDP-N-acetyl-D-mannosaminuronate dehydrogenase
MNIVVIGGGKMGQPIACMFAYRDASVTVCDTSTSVVDDINRGEDPRDEPERGSYRRNAWRAGTLQGTTETARGRQRRGGGCCSGASHG